MNYTPVKCPNCGSGSIVPAESGRIYCKSCDQFFEKPSKPSERIPLEPKSLPLESANDMPLIGSRVFAYYVILVAVMGFLVFLAFSSE